MSPSVAAAYDVAAPSYDAWAWQRVWSQVELPWLRKIIRPADRVVVLGIGTGASMEALGAGEVHGVDVSPGMLAVARRRLPHASLRVEDARYTSLPAGRAEVVVCVRMLSHVPDPEAVLREARRLLRSGGRLLLADVHPGHAYGKTRLRFGQSRVDVPTWKHDPRELIGAGWEDVQFRTSLAEDLAWGRDVVAGAGSTRRPFGWRCVAEAA